MPDLLNASDNTSKDPQKTGFDPSIYRRSSEDGPEKKSSRSPRKGSRLLLWSSVSLIVVALMIGGLFFSRIVGAINSTNSQTGEKIGLIEQIKHLINNPEEKLAGETDDRVNILLAGIGGAGHPGSYLADTIILASIQPSTGNVATMSIPRDLYVDIPEYGWRKINNAMAFGVQSDYPGGGEALLAETVEQTFDIPIHYYARIDFEGFRRAIDDLGGVEIDVERSFTDYEYPDYNYGYQVVSFSEGIEKMGGERALQYVRSRHGTNGEGSDFARSQRQQKVLLALKDKFFSIYNFLNPSNVIQALDSLGQHNQTNMEIWEMIKLAKMMKDVGKDDIITITLDTSDEGLLHSDHTLDGAYILLPDGGDFSQIKHRLANVFETSDIVLEDARIELQNSTETAGLASETADALRGQQFNVVKVGNANADSALTQTTIYDLSGGTKPYTLVGLKNMLNARIAPASTSADTNGGSATPPIIGEDIDILIIIGSDFIDPAQLTAARISA